MAVSEPSISLKGHGKIYQNLSVLKWVFLLKARKLFFLITIFQADGVDITSKIREFKFHCVLFHNITFYAGGTVPWGNDHSEEYGKPSSCDGKIEVLGFTTATLAALQMGGRGERIAQCSKLKIITQKPIPMQVDGEPCLLAPSCISIGFHSKVPMLKRDKKLLCTPGMNRKAMKHEKCSDIQISTAVFIHLPVIVVGRHDYDTYRDSLDRLKDTGFEIGTISIESETELAQARQLIQKLLADHQMLPWEPGKDWRFLDCKFHPPSLTSIHTTSFRCLKFWRGQLPALASSRAQPRRVGYLQRGWVHHPSRWCLPIHDRSISRHWARSCICSRKVGYFLYTFILRNLSYFSCRFFVIGFHFFQKL